MIEVSTYSCRDIIEASAITNLAVLHLARSDQTEEVWQDTQFSIETCLVA